MKNNKSLITATVSTILFGILSKCLVGIPYMAWGHFNLYYGLSFVLWTIYLSSLFIAGKFGSGESERALKTVCSGFLFGVIASSIKAGLDAILMLAAGKINDQLLFSFIMEIGILLFGSMVILFLSNVPHKRKILRDRFSKKYAQILGGTIGIYLIAFFYFSVKCQALTPYTDIRSLTESGNISLDMLSDIERLIQYQKNFTLISTIVYVIVFIVLWYMLIGNSSSQEK